MEEAQELVVDFMAEDEQRADGVLGPPHPAPDSDPTPDSDATPGGDADAVSGSAPRRITSVRSVLTPILAEQRRRLAILSLTSVAGGFAEAAALVVIAHASRSR